MEKKKSYREEVAEFFIKGLTDDPVKFIKGWNFSETGNPENGSNGKKYNGVNRIYLKLTEMELGYGDNRWMTFKQIKDKGYHLKKGARGAKVEYYLPWDNKEKKWTTWDKYNAEEKFYEGDSVYNRYLLKQKIYTVFNGSLIDGLPEKELGYIKNSIDEDVVINKISQGMGVEIIESKNSKSAFYTPGEDYIKIPAKEQFKSQGDYVSTTLHELAHATGHEKRLNRDQEGRFGSKKYAFEELIAEITSSFMGEYVKEPITDEILDNHKAYIQSWAGSIKDNKNFLFKAIKEAEKASDYMIEIAHLQEYKNDRYITEEIERKFQSKFLTYDNGDIVPANDDTPSFKLENDITENIRTYAAQNGINRLDELQQKAVNGTLKDIKELYVAAKEREYTFSFSKDREEIEL